MTVKQTKKKLCACCFASALFFTFSLCAEWKGLYNISGSKQNNVAKLEYYEDNKLIPTKFSFLFTEGSIYLSGVLSPPLQAKAESQSIPLTLYFPQSKTSSTVYTFKGGEKIAFQQEDALAILCALQQGDAVTLVIQKQQWRIEQDNFASAWARLLPILSKKHLGKSKTPS